MKQGNIFDYIFCGYVRADRRNNLVGVDSLMDWCGRFLRREGFLSVPQALEDRAEWATTSGMGANMEPAVSAPDRGRSNVRRGQCNATDGLGM